MPKGYQPTLDEALATVDVTIANGRDILIKPSSSWGADLQAELVAEAQKALTLVAPVPLARDRVEALMTVRFTALIDRGSIIEGPDGLWHLEGTTIFKVQMPLATNDANPKALVYNASRSSSAFLDIDSALLIAMKDRPKAYFYGRNYDHATDDGCIEQLCELDLSAEAPEQDW